MVKNRAFLIILIGAIFFYLLLNYFLSSGSSGESDQSSVDSAPNISTAPGSVTENERYRELQQQANKEQAEDAKKNMKSFVPTLVNRSNNEDSALLDKLLEEKRREKDEEEDARQKALREAQELSRKRLKEQQERMDKLRREQEERRRAAEAAKLADQKAKDYQRELERRKKAYLDKIATIELGQRYQPVQSYVAGSASDQAAINGANSGNNGSVDTSSAPLYKAGAILYAVVETSLNTDEPAPILAKITSGPLAGSRLIGSAKALGTEWAQGVVVEFSTISIPSLSSSLPIKTIAVDPSSARTALADEVNNHYIQRYGALFFSKLLEGYASAIQSSGSTSEKDADGNTTTTNSETSDAENFLIALGNVGSAVSSQVATLVNRPPTIKINQGSAVGLLLLDDFSIQ